MSASEIAISRVCFFLGEEMYKRDSWKEFGYGLESYEGAIKNLNYGGSLDWQEDRSAYLGYRNMPENCISKDQALSILSTAVKSSVCGMDLLKQIPIPDFPKAPARPGSPMPERYDFWKVEKADRLEKRAQELRDEFRGRYERETAQLEKVRTGCLANDPESIRALMLLAHKRNILPKPLRGAFRFDLDSEARVGLCAVEIPDFKRLPIVKRRGDSWDAKWGPVSAADRKRANEVILHSLCLRAASLVAKCDIGIWFDTVAVNAEQKWFDSATGAPKEGVIASLQASKAEIIALNLELVEPKTCFHHLKGITTPSVENVSPIRPSSCSIRAMAGS